MSTSTCTKALQIRERDRTADRASALCMTCGEGIKDRPVVEMEAWAQAHWFFGLRLAA